MSKRKNKPSIMYSTDGNGNWWKAEWQPQCQADAFLMGECQGVEGHKGVHWRFSQDGSFCYDDNDKDPSCDGCSGSIPPGHKDYRTPMEMEKHHHRRFCKQGRVVDKAEIARLEKGNIKPNESLTRPCTAEDILEIDAKLDKPPTKPKRGKPKVG